MKLSEGGSYAQLDGTRKFDSQQILIDPEHIEAMPLAFHKACSEDRESDPQRLCALALDRLSELRKAS
jgi:hypothetical protein